MAKVGEEEVEYESDPEEEKRLLGMRRREAASDDEEGGVAEDKHRVDRRGPIRSDESDGEGGAADYDDEGDDLDDEEEVYEEEEGEEIYENEEEEDIDGKEERGGRRRDSAVEIKERPEEYDEDRVEVQGVDDREEKRAEEEENEEGKKPNEPFAVPTAGAFYMHDDRFRDNAGGRHRRTYGGRKLWESKDDKRWGHDKFEEMNLQERHYDRGRRDSKGRYKSRGEKNQGPVQRYARRNMPKVFGNGNNHNQASKGVRGRGPIKYESRWKRSNQAPPTQSNQPEKSFEKTSQGSSGRAFTAAPNTESDQVLPARRNSSLSSASPPFYPSGASSKDVALNQKRDVQAGSTNRNLHVSVVDENFSAQEASALMRGKNIADPVGTDKLYIDDSVNSTAGKPLSSMQMQSVGSSFFKSTQSRTQGRGVAISRHMTHPSNNLKNQAIKVLSATPTHTVERNPVQNRVQPSVQATGQNVGQFSGSGSQASSPPKTALSVSSCEPGDGETSPESNKSGAALVGNGKGGIQGTGRGSFMYGRAQVTGATGNLGVGHGDQNFPAFLPVMQFGGQNPGGIGVPAVGMAFPGYVAQSQLGLGNSEMTWLPVLAGAAGALGASYCSPYISVDGTYHARVSEQTSSSGSSSKENDTNQYDDEWKPSNKPEIVNDEFGQRQKPRRYSEMDFKQPSTSA